MVHRGEKYGLKVDIAFSRAKAIVGWLQRATWNKRYKSSCQKCCTPSKLQIEIKKIITKKCCFKVQKMFLFAKIDKNVQFNSLFPGNS